MIYTTTKLKERFISYLIREFEALQKKPTLYAVQVGNNPVSTKYISIKQQLATRLGCELKILHFPETTNTEQVIKEIKNISKQDGLIYQLPIPPKFHSLVENIEPSLDVDLLGNKYSQIESQGILPPTIGAIDLTLKHLFQQESFEITQALRQDMNLKGTKVGIIGQGKLVGTPLARYLLKRNATIISINVDTQKPQELTELCDIVISAAGKPKLVDKTWVRKDAIIIDAATSEGETGLVGDVDKDNIYESNILCTTPRGIGSLTVPYLFYNLWQLTKLRKSDL